MNTRPGRVHWTRRNFFSHVNFIQFVGCLRIESLSFWMRLPFILYELKSSDYAENSVKFAISKNKTEKYSTKAKSLHLCFLQRPTNVFKLCASFIWHLIGWMAAEIEFKQMFFFLIRILFSWLASCDLRAHFNHSIAFSAQYIYSLACSYVSTVCQLKSADSKHIRPKQRLYTCVVCSVCYMFYRVLVKIKMIALIRFTLQLDKTSLIHIWTKTNEFTLK